MVPKLRAFIAYNICKRLLLPWYLWQVPIFYEKSCGRQKNQPFSIDYKTKWVMQNAQDRGKMFMIHKKGQVMDFLRIF